MKESGIPSVSHAVITVSVLCSTVTIIFCPRFTNGEVEVGFEQDMLFLIKTHLHDTENISKGRLCHKIALVLFDAHNSSYTNSQHLISLVCNLVS